MSQVGMAYWNRQGNIKSSEERSAAQRNEVERVERSSQNKLTRSSGGEGRSVAEFGRSAQESPGEQAAIERKGRGLFFGTDFVSTQTFPL